ncbi:uncharacterized protein LOC128993538 [Macrosteles quadrilineatus]|uniref:uncharacterized protein LOC128993538 n=1 Tax=Macrosteles quadrilineatus TaxID=74068 RepID=UPI0023E15681|nr:uncharacterized protein LOC128993538 [Macrosteles quadrilineatus]
MLSTRPILLLLLIAVFSVNALFSPNSWFFGVDRASQKGQASTTVVQGQASFPLLRGNDGRSLNANVHGTQMFSGPYSAQAVGGGLRYQQNGLYAGVGTTNVRGVGNGFTATAGGTRGVGPGNLSMNVEATTSPGSSGVQAKIGAKYEMQF